MARQINGVGYFPLMCSMDDSMKLIEAEYGLIGFAVVVKLWQKIYAGQGYYCEWTNEVELLFSSEIKLGRNSVSEIVNCSIRRGVFDKTLFEKYQILTSKGIQERYFEATKRRNSVNVDTRYLLVSVPTNAVNVNRNVENVCRNAENVCRNTQRKEKERKVKESKENSICSEQDAPAHEPIISLMLVDKSLFPIYETDVAFWTESFPAVNVPVELKKIAAWLDANPAKRKTKNGIKRFVVNWLSKTQDRGGYSFGQNQSQGNQDIAVCPSVEVISFDE